MNHKHRVTIIFLILLSLTLVGLLVYRLNATRLEQTRPVTDETELREETPTPTQEPPPMAYKDLLEITLPRADENSSVPVCYLQSPKTTCKIAGRARGTWFFEASFPVKLLSPTGETIATAIMQADGDWMTTEFVPFSGEMTFEVAGDQLLNMAGSYSLIFQKDNPSGEAKFDDQFILPIFLAP